VTQGRNMDKNAALQFLAQVAQDFLNTLPPSAKEGFRQHAQQAITALQQPDPPPKAEP
jgi:hypothetical protein